MADTAPPTAVEPYGQEWINQMYAQLAPQIEAQVHQAFGASRGARFGAQGSVLTRRLAQLATEIATEAAKQKATIVERQRQEGVASTEKQKEFDRQQSEQMRRENVAQNESARNRSLAEQDRQKNVDYTNLMTRAKILYDKGQLNRETWSQLGGSDTEWDKLVASGKVSDQPQSQTANAGFLTEPPKAGSPFSTAINPTTGQRESEGVSAQSFAQTPMEEKIYGPETPLGLNPQPQDKTYGPDISRGFYPQPPTSDLQSGSDTDTGIPFGGQNAKGSFTPQQSSAPDPGGKWITQSWNPRPSNGAWLPKNYSETGTFWQPTGSDGLLTKPGGIDVNTGDTNQVYADLRTRTLPKEGVDSRDSYRPPGIQSMPIPSGSQDDERKRMLEETDQAYISDRPGSFNPYTPGKRTDLYNRDLGSGNISPRGFKKTYDDTVNTGRDLWNTFSSAWG